MSAINSITATIEQVNTISRTIADAVQQQGDATTEIARNVAQAAAGTSEVSSNISGVSEAAKETEDVSSQMVQMICGGELVILPGAGHALIEAHDQLRRPLAEWIRTRFAPE